MARTFLDMNFFNVPGYEYILWFLIGFILVFGGMGVLGKLPMGRFFGIATRMFIGGLVPSLIFSTSTINDLGVFNFLILFFGLSAIFSAAMLIFSLPLFGISILVLIGNTFYKGIGDKDVSFFGGGSSGGGGGGGTPVTNATLTDVVPISGSAFENGLGSGWDNKELFRVVFDKRNAQRRVQVDFEDSAGAALTPGQLNKVRGNTNNFASVGGGIQLPEGSATMVTFPRKVNIVYSNFENLGLGPGAVFTIKLSVYDSAGTTVEIEKTIRFKNT